MGLGMNAVDFKVESDDYSMPAGFSVPIEEHWDGATAPALPTGSFIYTGSLVTDDAPPVPPISDPNVLEAAAHASGYAAFNTVDDSTGDVSVSAWFCIPPGGYYGSDLPASITVTFDSSVVWGDLAGTTITIDFDPALGDYPSACLTTTTDGGNCDGGGATEGLLTVTLTVVSSGVVDAVAQWSGGTHGTDCADGSCSYYGTASGTGIPEDNSSHTLTFGPFGYTAGGSGTFLPGETFGSPTTEDWDGVTAPALPAAWDDISSSYQTATAWARSSPNSVAAVGIASDKYLTYGTADTSSGNIVVAASFYATSWASDNTVIASVFCRSSTTDPSAHCYKAYISFGTTTGAVVLEALTGGGQLVLADVGNVVFAATTAYRLTLAASGSALAVSVERESDGHWLQADGTWAATEAFCLSAADTTFSGAGYFGLGMSNNASAFSLMSDDYTWTPITDPGTPATISLQVPTP
jgi:hypothetical protein